MKIGINLKCKFTLKLREFFRKFLKVFLNFKVCWTLPKIQESTHQCLAFHYIRSWYAFLSLIFINHFSQCSPIISFFHFPHYGDSISVRKVNCIQEMRFGHIWYHIPDQIKPCVARKGRTRGIILNYVQKQIKITQTNNECIFLI